MQDKLISELVRRLKIRKQQLMEGSSYPMHVGHHLRDVFTVLVVLEKNENAEKFIKNLPDKV